MTTAYDVVRGALRLIGVVTPIDPPSAEEADDALAVMNQMLASWSSTRFASASVPLTSFALTAGDGEYTIGDGGNINTIQPTGIYRAHVTNGGLDYPVRLISLGEYQDIADKSASGDIPQVMAIRPGYPLATLYLYPVPGAGNTLVLDKVAPLADLALSDDMPYPPVAIRAIRYNLAIELAPEYGAKVPSEIVAIADQSMQAWRRVNLQIPAARIDPLLCRRGLNNVQAIKSGIA